MEKKIPKKRKHLEEEEEEEEEEEQDISIPQQPSFSRPSLKAHQHICTHGQ
jgi:hypothetical protein